MKASGLNCPHCGYSVQPEMQLCRNCGAALHPHSSNDLLRLDPFAFPRDTDFRLIILIISVLGASLFIYGDLYYAISGIDNFVPLHCALWMLGGSLLVMVVAGVIYWFKPEWEIRRGDWQILQDEDVPAPGITTYLTNLCQEVGLKDHPPIFLWHPLTDDGGQAFGRIGRVYVYLSGSLVRLFKDEIKRKRSEFRANVLHELAHICNSDVHRVSLSIAVWYAFMITALPVFVITLLNSPLERIVKMSWRSLLLVLLVYLTWCAILRVREFYADVKAYTLDGFSNTLRYVREETAERQRTTLNYKKDNVLQQAWLKTWKRIASYHPNAKEQIHILENPTTLMKMSFWDAFATGMATTTTFFNVVTLALLLLVRSQENFNQFLLSDEIPEALDKFGFLMFLVPALIFASVVIYIVGLGTWRIVLAEMIRGKQIHGIGKLALGLAGGMVMGLQTSFLAASNFGPSIIVVFLIGLLLLFILTIFFHWMALGASTWLPVAMVSQSPRPFYRWGLAAAGIVLIWLIDFLHLAFVSFTGGTSIHYAMAASPLTTLALVCLWGFPLAAWFRHKKVGQATLVSDWLVLDKLPRSIDLPHQAAHLKPNLALLLGLVSGSLGSLLLLILLPRATVMGVGAFSFLLAGSVCIQMIVGVIATICIRDLSHLHGLFGAFVAGCILAMTAIVTMLSGGTGIEKLQFIALMIINSGGLFALPTVLIVSTIAGCLRRTRLQTA